MVRNLEDRLAHVEQWKKSGLTQKAYCAQENIKLGTFWTWVMRSKQIQESSFVELKSSEVITENLVLHYPNGVCLEIPRALCKSQLKTLIHLF